MTIPASFVAAPGKRVAAFIYDAVAVVLVFMVVAVFAESVGYDLTTLTVLVCCSFLYHGAFLVFRDGRTFGKVAQDICVVTNDGQSPRIWQAFARAAVRYFPLLSATALVYRHR